jgi:hypothetical protein
MNSKARNFSKSQLKDFPSFSSSDVIFTVRQPESQGQKVIYPWREAKQDIRFLQKKQ